MLQPLLDLFFKMESLVLITPSGKKIIKYVFENIVPLYSDVKTLILTINFSNVVECI